MSTGPGATLRAILLLSTVSCASTVDRPEPRPEPRADVVGATSSVATAEATAPSDEASIPSPIMASTPPSRLITPPTSAEAGGPCAVSQAIEIGRSALPLHDPPLVRIGATLDGVLIAWGGDKGTLRTRALSRTAELRGEAERAHGGHDFDVAPLADGTFALLFGDQRSRARSNLLVETVAATGGTTTVPLLSESGSWSFDHVLTANHATVVTAHSWYSQHMIVIEPQAGAAAKASSVLLGDESSRARVYRPFLGPDAKVRVLFHSGEQYILRVEGAAPVFFDMDGEEMFNPRLRVERDASVIALDGIGSDSLALRFDPAARTVLRVPVDAAGFPSDLGVGLRIGRRGDPGAGFFLIRSGVTAEDALLARDQDGPAATLREPYRTAAVVWAQGVIIAAYARAHVGGWKIYVTTATCPEAS